MTQAILKREDAKTTQWFYNKTVREDVSAGMKQLKAQIVQRLYSKNHGAIW